MKNKKWLMPVVSICVVITIAVAAVVLWPKADNDGDTEIVKPVNVMNEGMELVYPSKWSAFMSSAPGLVMELKVDETLFPGKSVTFEVRADWPMECFYDYLTGGVEMTKEEAYLGDRFSVENGTRLLWRSTNDAFLDIDDEDFFVNIVIKADEQPVGFAVVMLDRTKTGMHSFDVRLLGNELYPPVDGQLQNITETYIEKQIKRLRYAALDDGFSPLP